MLTGTNGIELVEIDNQVVGKCHLLVELIRKVQMIEVILSQMWRKQPTKEGCLSTALCSNQRWYTFVAVQQIQL